MLAYKPAISVSKAQLLLLADVARCDGKITEAEVRTALAIASEVDYRGPNSVSDMFEFIKTLTWGEMELALSTLRHAVRSIREKTVQLLWVMAICDGDLHPKQERKIYAIADALRIDRQTLTLQQPDF